MRPRAISNFHREFEMAHLAEPYRKKAFSVDLHWRVVYQRIAINLPFNDIAKNLNIAASTAHRTYTLFERTGKVDPVDSSSGRELRKLDRSGEVCVIGLILENPSMYLHKVCQELKECFDSAISPSTICTLLKGYGATRKKIRQVAKQRCDALRGAFVAQTFLFKGEMFVWLDETGPTRETN